MMQILNMLSGNMPPAMGVLYTNATLDTCTVNGGKYSLARISMPSSCCSRTTFSTSIHNNRNHCYQNLVACHLQPYGLVAHLHSSMGHMNYILGL